MKYPCIENTIEFDISNRYPHLNFRFWINTDQIQDYAVNKIYGDDIKKTITGYLDKTFGSPCLPELFDVCSKIPNVNAVQIIWNNEDGYKQGIVVYTVPFNDIKG